MFKLSCATITLLLLATAEAHFGFGIPPAEGATRLPRRHRPRPHHRPQPYGTGSTTEQPETMPAPQTEPIPQPQPQPQPRPQLPEQFDRLRLCTTTQLEQNKCLYALDVAANNSIELRLQCIQADSFADCLDVVQMGVADFVVADDHEYLKARFADMVPLLYAHEPLTGYYLALALKNITLTELNEAKLDVDSSNNRAYHAAALLNLQRGHGVCGGDQSVEGNVKIKIINSANYSPTTDDELLICDDGIVLKARRIVEYFSVIPVNRNDVTEGKFYTLHCDQVAQDHNRSYIE